MLAALHATQAAMKLTSEMTDKTGQQRIDVHRVSL
jgi:hypothetical protein